MSTTPPVSVVVPCTGKFKHHYNDEVHRVYDFVIRPEMVHDVVQLCFDLTTSGFGPLDRRLLRATLLLNGVAVLSEIRYSSQKRRFEIPHTRHGRNDVLRLPFSNNVLPLAGTNNFLTVRLVCNARLGQTYMLQAWVYRALSKMPTEVDLRFFEERGDTFIDLKNGEVRPMRFYYLITGRHTDMTELYDKLQTLASSPPRSP